MKKLNLMLHCGARHVSRKEVMDAPVSPSLGSRHKPIAHGELVNMLTSGIKDYGMEVVQEAHGLFGRRGGPQADRWFGMFQVAGGDGANHDDYGFVFGLRNSHDQTFPAGLCLGNGVFVCDNLAFNAEIVLKTRHTTNIMDRLPGIFSRAMGSLVQARTTQDKRIETYKDSALTDADAHDLILRSYKAGAVMPSRIAKVYEQWHNPEHDEFKPRTMWSLYNNFTEVWKQSSIIDLPRKTAALDGLLDAECGLVTNAASDIRQAFTDNEDVVVA